MGDKKIAVFKSYNEMELLTTNIALGNENYKLEEDAKELIKMIAKAEEKIINKIAKVNNAKGFSMILLNDNMRKN